MSADPPENLFGDDSSGTSRRQSGSSRREVSSDEELKRFVFVRIGEQRLALSVDDVRSITELPMEPKRVPRSTDAVEGLVDLRGEITVVINPRIHFPVDEPPSTRQRLVVFDRPSDRQPAAMRVDEILGVETTPVSNVIETASKEAAGGALEHPLIAALVKQEQEQNVDIRGLMAGGETDRQSSDDPGSFATRSVEAVRKETAGDSFSADLIDEDEQEEAIEDQPAQTTVEITALLDVERLLLASGQTAVGSV